MNSFVATVSSLADSLQPFWIALGITLVAGAFALMVVLIRRPIHVRKLGCVSDRWIAAHRADLP